MMKSVQITPGMILDCVYCKRRYYLRSIERNNASQNVYMELGKEGHEIVDIPSAKFVNGVFTMTSVQCYLEKYNLYGICDMVEFPEIYGGIIMDYVDYPVAVVPVEFKHGKTRFCNEYIAQLVTYAMCLESIYNCHIDYGYIYYIDSDKRVKVDISETYRRLVTNAIYFITNYDGSLIKPKYSRKCKDCSMFDTCRPRETNIKDYVKELWNI